MRIKLIKSVLIGHHQFTVKYDKKSGGGYFSFEDRIIVVGIQHIENDPISVVGVLMHELMEVICCITNTRYSDWGTMKDFKFFMTHKEFQTNMEMFTQALSNFIT